MAHLVNRSRIILVGAAFVAVMAGAGGLLGALAGVVLALLARTILAITVGTGELIAAWMLAGALAALLLSLYLTTRLPARLVSTPKVVPTPAQATESN
jgi:hypothetical protein